MSGAGIAIIDGGNIVQNCYVGTNTGRDGRASRTTAPESRVTTTALGPYPARLPSAAGHRAPSCANIVGHPSDAAKGNLISGNHGVGVDIFGERTVKMIVANNLIGTNAAGTAGDPERRPRRRQDRRELLSRTRSAPGNVISGETPATLDDGVTIRGKVWEPNVVKGNIIGAVEGPLDEPRLRPERDRRRRRPATTRCRPRRSPRSGRGTSSASRSRKAISVTGVVREGPALRELHRHRRRTRGDARPSSIDIGNGRTAIRIRTSGVSPTDNDDARATSSAGRRRPGPQRHLGERHDDAPGRLRDPPRDLERHGHRRSRGTSSAATG